MIFSLFTSTTVPNDKSMNTLNHIDGVREGVDDAEDESDDGEDEADGDEEEDGHETSISQHRIPRIGRIFKRIEKNSI